MSPAPEQIKDCLVHAGIAGESLLDGVYKELLSTGAPLDSKQILKELRGRGTLTSFQADEINAGRGRNLRLGNYLLLDRIGQGGMGTVYKAWHMRMCRVVAIKVLAAERSHTGEFASRFQREVQAIARLNHPNIVSAYDADDSPMGSYLVMEYVNGSDLGQVVERSGPLGLEEAVVVVRQVAEALEFAHAHGVVHRDIKPGNLLRDASGVAKVADLGLAQLEARDLEVAGGAAYTRSCAIAGTVDYMAPEQAASAHDIDHRADIYSLGCTLFYLLTGRPVFLGPTLAARLVAHSNDPPPSLRAFRSDAPELLDAIFQRMVAKSPVGRYGSMREVMDNLKLLLRPADAAPPAWNPATSTVLLAEPSNFQANIIQEYLHQIGINDVYAFRSGQEVIDALAELPADLILTSMQLADTTGIELAERIRHELRWKRLGIVLMTSSEVGSENMAAVERLVISQLLIKPFDQSQLAAALENAVATQEAPMRMAGLETLRVLLVDDSSMWRLRLQRILEALGFVHFVAASDGVEAAARLQAERFHLVLTDYHMPNMSGKELVAHIRQSSSHSDVPVVVVTTEYDPLKLAEAHQLGASAICHKSSDPQLLRNIIMRLLS